VCVCVCVCVCVLDYNLLCHLINREKQNGDVLP